jgi:hypothetical protein
MSDISARRTIIAFGRLAMREIRLEAARERQHGLQVMTFEQMAARLAGGLSQPIDIEALRVAIQVSLLKTYLGELDRIKSLPGMVDAAVDSLHKAWRAGIDLRSRALDHPRLESMASLEEAVLAALPPAMMRPADLVALAQQRLDYAPVLFGSIDIVGITELSPCWRPLLKMIAARIPVRWVAGPRSIPPWLDGSGVSLIRSESQEPAITAVSASTAYHEAIEAIRWARQLIASGRAEPGDIAIASVSPAEYDDEFLALGADANLDIHFVHGVKVTVSREGQAAAALADIVVRGLSQTRIRRLARLLDSNPGPFHELPLGWIRILPADAPLVSPEAWFRLLDRLKAADWPDGIDHGTKLRAIIALLAEGINAADVIGETLLIGRARDIWRKALLAGPAVSLELTLDALKQDDNLEACVSIAWMPASALAASPRKFARLLGLNSSRWPRGISEDRLISDHIIPTAQFDPLPVGEADRRDFETILATTSCQVVLSRARRASEGRLLGRSTLLRGQHAEVYLRRNAMPAHAFSESDRLMARPDEFRSSPQAIAAIACWHDWHREELTPHDGLVRPDHPALLAVLDRTQSASSLRQLLRNPLGFVWRYAMHWQAPTSGTDPLVLDALALGDLIHMTLDLALRRLESDSGISGASSEAIASAVDSAASEVAQLWETERAVPPRVIWRHTLDDLRVLSRRALDFNGGRLPGADAFGEVPFGGAEPKSDAAIPWDPSATVEIPGAGFRIKGYIDRLDISDDRRSALVRDYKTGRPPKEIITLNGGKELQRCLYAFAVKKMLGPEVAITASLFYLLNEADLRLENPEATLVEIADYLSAARKSLSSGTGVIGPDSGGAYDDLAFALPANAGAAYCNRKISLATQRLGAAAKVWEAQ